MENNVLVWALLAMLWRFLFWQAQNEIYKTICACTSIFLWTKKTLCVCFPLHTQNNFTFPNCKIPPRACFINISHSSTGLPTEDYGELLECHLCLPDQRGASTIAKHGEQKGSAQIRHLHTRHQGVMSFKENSQSRALLVRGDWRRLETKGLEQVAAH